MSRLDFRRSQHLSSLSPVSRWQRDHEGSRRNAIGEFRCGHGLCAGDGGRLGAELAGAQISAHRATAAAHRLGLPAIVLQASTEGDLDTAFATLIQRRAGGLVISPDTFFSGKSAEIAALAARYAVPTISPYREFPRVGGLMSYGVSLTELYRLVGVYAGRILKGDKPADLPVRQATRLELVVNMETAK